MAAELAGKMPAPHSMPLYGRTGDAYNVGNAAGSRPANLSLKGQHMRAMGWIVSAMVAATALPAMAAEDAILKNAPKDAIAIIHADGKALEEYVKKVEAVFKENSVVAEAIATVAGIGKMLKNVEAVEIYVSMSEFGPMPICLAKTPSTVPELYGLLKEAKLPNFKPVEPKLDKNGCYTMEGTQIVIVEGTGTNGVDKGQVAIAMSEDAIKSLKGGAGEKLMELAKKVDTSAAIWGVGDLSFVREADAPATVIVCLFTDGKKPSNLTLTFRSEEAAGKMFKEFPKDDSVVKGLGTFTQNKVDLTLSATLNDAYVGNAAKALYRARELARRAASAANLSAIGKAIALYEAINNDTKITSDPNELIKENLVGPSAFFKPGSGRTPEKDEKGGLKNAPDYVIFDLPMDAPADLAKAYEPLELNKGEGGNVLMRDSSVRWLKPDELKAAVAKTEKYLKDAKEKK